MRRSSKIIVLLVGILVLGLVTLLQFADEPALPFGVRVVDQSLQRSNEALARHDGDRLLRMLTPDARVLGVGAERFRVALQQSLGSVQPGKFEMKWRDISLDDNLAGQAFFHLRLYEAANNADITYYEGRVRILFQKVSSPRLFGLFHSDEWRVAEVEASAGMSLTKR